MLREILRSRLPREAHRRGAPPPPPFTKRRSLGSACVRLFLLATVLMSSPEKTTAQEIKLLKFICNSEGGVVDVVARVDDLIIGLSPLPSGCDWLPPMVYGTIGKTVLQIDVPGGRAARISRVAADGRIGFSAGLVELLF